MLMNEQYEYVGKTLTPKIARELIQELFAGQTVQKQKIMTIVDKTHLERGGLPSIARSNNPITLALFLLNWKRRKYGLARLAGLDLVLLVELERKRALPFQNFLR